YIVVERFAGGSGNTFDIHFTENTGGCPEDCNDGVDNDLDGDTDCADSQCIGDPVCPEICNNSLDDDGDGDIDCDDSGCFSQSYCCDDDQDGFLDESGTCGGT